MVDPLKNKFKHFTFKLYDPVLRHDKEYFDKIHETFLSDKEITIADWWYDYDPHVGIHSNGVFRSNSYKTMYKKYSAKETKLPGLYLDFGDIINTKEYNGWIIYCIRRYDTNYKRMLPSQRTINNTTTINSPPNSPSSPPNSTLTF